MIRQYNSPCQGRRKGRPWHPWILKISAKKGCFLSFEWEKTSFTTFAIPLEKFWRNPLVPRGKNPSDARAPCSIFFCKPRRYRCNAVSETVWKNSFNDRTNNGSAEKATVF